MNSIFNYFNLEEEEEDNDEEFSIKQESGEEIVDVSPESEINIDISDEPSKNPNLIYNFEINFDINKVIDSEFFISEVFSTDFHNFSIGLFLRKSQNLLFPFIFFSKILEPFKINCFF